MNQESPWQQASGGIGQLGQTFQHLVLSLAQQKYQQQMAQQQMLMHQQQLDQQAPLNLAHANYYNSMADKSRSAGMLDTLKGQTAQNFGNAYARNLMPPVEAPRNTALEMLGVPGGTSIPYGAIAQQQNQDNQFDVNKFMAMLAGLSGKLGDVNKFQVQQTANQNLGTVTPEMAMQLLGVRPTTVGHQGGVMNPATGKIEQVMPQILQEGATLTPGTTSVPSAIGQPKAFAPHGSGLGPAIQAVTSAGGEVPFAEANPSIAPSIFNMITNQGPGQVNQPQMRQPTLPKVLSRNDPAYIQLKSGDKYIGPDGLTATKQ